MRVRLTWLRGEAVLILDPGATAERVAAALPAAATAHRWGDEVYFHLPVSVRLDADATDVVAPGTVCYWVEGASIAIPFGPTPASLADECRLVTRVNSIGRLEGDPRLLVTLAEGDRLELAPETA
jgi:hypothetical protein